MRARDSRYVCVKRRINDRACRRLHIRMRIGRSRYLVIHFQFLCRNGEYVPPGWLQLLQIRELSTIIPRARARARIVSPSLWTKSSESATFCCTERTLRGRTNADMPASAGVIVSDFPRQKALDMRPNTLWSSLQSRREGVEVFEVTCTNHACGYYTHTRTYTYSIYIV